MKQFLILASALPLVVLGALHATASSNTGYIEGGNIYFVSSSGNSVTYKVRITDPGAAALHGVTVKVGLPTRGTSSAHVCAQNAFPNCTDDAAPAVSLPGGQTLTYQSGSLSGASGNIFAGASVGTVQPGLSGTHYVSFTMTRHNPAPAPKPVAPAAPTHSTPAPVNTGGNGTIATHHHRVVPVASSSQSQPQTQPNQTVTLPPVNVTVPENTPTETAAQTTAPATTTTDDSDLGTAGVTNPFVALFAAAIGGGALAYRRSRQRLVESILG